MKATIESLPFPDRFLCFLGRGAAFNAAEGNTAAYLREDDRLFLVDCGETVFHRLLSLGVLEGVRSVMLVLSHLHSDHCGSLGSLVLYCRYVLHCVPLLVLPAGEASYAASVRALLSAWGVPENAYRCVGDGPVAGFTLLRAVRYVPTAHDPRLACHSFVIDTAEGAVFYSADTCRTDELKHFVSAHSQIAAIYMEVTDAPAQGGVHLPLSLLQEALPAALRPKARLMHFPNPECLQKCRREGFLPVRPAQ